MYVPQYKIGAPVWLETNGAFLPGLISDYRDTEVGRIYQITIDSGHVFESRFPERRITPIRYENKSTSPPNI